MAFRKETKIKSNFSKISIGLASPEEILEITNVIAVSTNVSVIKVLFVTDVALK